MTEPIRLHLGCGPVRIEGMTNVDNRYQPSVDRVDNIGILKRYEPGSVDEIYSSHNFDMFSRWDYPRVLKRWHELLKPGGLLRISVIDFEQIVELYKSGTPLAKLTGMLHAAQDYPESVRHMHWDFASLCCDLTAVGFTAGVRRVGANRFCEEYGIKDCSCAILEGVPVSLNVETRKPE